MLARAKSAVFRAFHSSGSITRRTILGQFVAVAALITACSQAPERIVLTPPPMPNPPAYEAALPTAPESRQCVPYARYLSGINLQGDAYTWWDSAAGRYLRGQQPMPGAVLVLSRSNRLSRGHLAVVRQVIDARRILVDHANWKPGEVTAGMAVADVSPNNDWTQLRFYNEEYQSYGSVYPANGFIYNMADAPGGGTTIVSSSPGGQTYVAQ
jgi:surface antigen